MKTRLGSLLVVVALGAVACGCGSSKGGRSSRALAGAAALDSHTVTTAQSGTGGGTVTIDPPSATGFYPGGTALTITATPDAASFFAGWGGDLAGQTQNPLQLTLGRDTVITALFDLPAAGTPRADFATTPARPAGPAPLAVTFTDASTGSPTSWRWDFGDGQSATGRTASHTYQTPGRYTVTLTASNAAGPGLPAIKRDLVVVVDRNAGSPFWYLNDTYGNPYKTHTASEASFTAQVLTLLNAERTRAGVPPVQADAQAERAAKVHCEDMSGRRFFDHITPEGWTPDDRMRMTGGSGYSLIGENIAVGQRTPFEVITAWYNSPGHRMNMLDPRFTHVGIGLDEQGFYWAQVFIAR